MRSLVGARLRAALSGGVRRCAWARPRSSVRRADSRFADRSSPGWPRRRGGPPVAPPRTPRRPVPVGRASGHGAVRGARDLDRHLRHRRLGAPGARGPVHGRARRPDDLPAELELPPQPAVRAPRGRGGDRGRRAPAGARGGRVVPARVPRPPARPAPGHPDDPVRDPPAATGSIRSRSTSSPRRSAGRACGPPVCSGCRPRSGAPPAPSTRSARSWPPRTGWSGPIRSSGRASPGAGSPTPTTSSCR